MADARDFPDSLPAPRRAELMERLKAALPRQLGWLEEQHGFRMTEVRWPVARLESRRVRVEIGYSGTHGPALTLGVAVGEHGDPDARSLATTQRLLGVPEHPSREWVIESDDDVDTALARVAAQLRTIEPLLAGDEQGFATLRRREREAAARIGVEEGLRTAGPDAKEAFQAGDYERVVALLDPLEGHLKPHEQGWLDYARRKRAAPG